MPFMNFVDKDLRNPPYDNLYWLSGFVVGLSFGIIIGRALK
jgi:hypothetical protein